jgi:hypothetical protein
MSSDKPNENLKLYNKTLDTSCIQGFFVFKRYLYTNDFIMKKIIRLTEGDLHKIVKKSVNKILRESYYNPDEDDFDDDDELNDELEAAGATGGATEEQLFGWREDLWININKTLQNANYLFNKTRDERYAKIAEAVSNALDYFPEGESYMTCDYDPDAGYGG